MNTKEQAKKARNLMRTLAIGIAVVIAIMATFIWTQSSDKQKISTQTEQTESK